MKKFKTLTFIILAIFALSACSDDKEPRVHEVKNILANNSNWTYISLATGKAVGYSAFGNKDQDAQWSQRTDWDIAVCGEYIRTNGGTSGVGNAALGVSKVPYDITSRIEVTADVDTIEVWEEE